jgi:hypothetical protein
MSTALRDTMNAMVAEFATSIIEAIHAATLADILDVRVPLAPRRDRGRRRGSITKTVTTTDAPSDRAAPPESRRRGRPQNSAEDAELIVAYLRSHPGSTGEEARKTLGLKKNRWNTCMYRAIREGKIRKEGKHRSTRYWATG